LNVFGNSSPADRSPENYAWPAAPSLTRSSRSLGEKRGEKKAKTEGTERAEITEIRTIFITLGGPKAHGDSPENYTWPAAPSLTRSSRVVRKNWIWRNNAWAPIVADRSRRRRSTRRRLLEWRRYGDMVTSCWVRVNAVTLVSVAW